MSKNQNSEAAAQARSEHVAALKSEREGYKRRGLSDRVKQVDAQINHFTGKPSGRTSTAPDATASADTGTATPAKKTAAKKTAAKKTAASPSAAASTADAEA